MPDDHGLRLPPRTSPSLEQTLADQAKENAMSALGALRIYSSWWEELSERPFDIPMYLAVKGIAAITVYFSSRGIGDPGRLTRIFLEDRPWTWHVKAFVGGAYPVLRCSLAVPDDPADPFILESPLDIRVGDVQEFCKAMVLDERLDLVVAHEAFPKDQVAAASYRAPGAGALLRQQFNLASDDLRPDATDDDFETSVRAMERAYPTAISGLREAPSIRLEPAGGIQNRMLEFEF